MIVKICGLRRIEDLEVASTAGADVLGMITGVPESPRNNELDDLTTLMGHVPKAKKAAVLFRNAPEEVVFRSIDSTQPNIVHLCGDEGEELWGTLRNRFPGMEIWKSIGVPVDDPESQAWRTAFQRARSAGLDHVVLDSSRGGKTGGVGKTFPLKQVVEHLGEDLGGAILAGGLNPDNLTEVLQSCRPMGVDVSGGVESQPGMKDPERVRRFIEIAKQPS